MVHDAIAYAPYVLRSTPTFPAVSRTQTGVAHKVNR